jgi:hypothetical protein
VSLCVFRAPLHRYCEVPEYIHQDNNIKNYEIYTSFFVFACTNAVTQTDLALGEIKLFSVVLQEDEPSRSLLPINHVRHCFFVGTTYGGMVELHLHCLIIRGRKQLLDLDLILPGSEGDETVVLSTSNLPV